MARSAAASGCKPQSYRPHFMLVCIENSKEQSIMNTLRQGAVAGLLAGLILGMLGFVDYGPGNTLGGVARWLALDNRATGRGAGFLMLIVLGGLLDRKSTRLNSSHQIISYAVFCLKKK